MTTLSCLVCARPWREVEHGSALGVYLRLAPYLRIVHVSGHLPASYLPVRPLAPGIVAGRAACESWPLHYWSRITGLRALAWGDRGRDGAIPTFGEFLAAYSLRIAPVAVSAAPGNVATGGGTGRSTAEVGGIRDEVAAPRETSSEAGVLGRAPATRRLRGSVVCDARPETGAGGVSGRRLETAASERGPRVKEAAVGDRSLASCDAGRLYLLQARVA